MKIGINCYIDVSGNPYEKTVIGLVTFNPHTANNIIKEFRKKFPQFSKARIKGKKLNSSELRAIIAFLNSRKVHMYSIVFDNKKWFGFKTIYGKRAFFKEKIFAILYFMLLSRFAYQKYKYPITVCKENFMNIEKVIVYCKKLAKANKYDFDFSVAYAKSNDFLKFADFVASARRKCSSNYLKPYKRFCTITTKINQLYINKLFGK